ncbi:MAG: C40 family peptidase [Hyphomicrobiaceae bacterium]|nr:C40 family peptidase [Hyphomicrobiaceae bacterium]
MSCERRSVTRADVVRQARTWIGTPYHHQASLAGVGTDCVGLVRGVWRALYGREPAAPPPYTRDWAEASGRETLLDAAGRHLVEVNRADPQPGDVLVFRHRPSLPAKHAAILATAATMIHATEGAPVAEVAFAPWWRRRLAGVYSFPEITG